MLRLWYLRRAVPWTALLGFLGLAALLVVAVHRWESLAVVGLPLVALLAAMGAALVYDDPAVAVTALTPRGARWSQAHRLAAGAVPLGVGVALLAASPAPVDVRGWSLVVLGTGALALLLALVATQRQLPRPGSTIASGLVLVGLAPLLMRMFMPLPSPYPAPELTSGVLHAWVACACLGGVALAARLSGPVRRRRTRSPLPSDLPGDVSRPFGTAVTGDRDRTVDTIAGAARARET